MGEYRSNYNGDSSETAPPKAVDVVAGIFEKYHKQSNLIPARPFDAAWWWLDHQEQPNENTERVERTTDRNGKVGWKTPYIDRVTSTLRTFLSLEPIYQVFVIEKIKSGIPWRGDDIEMFKLICEQEDLMRQDKDAYIAKASAVFQNFRAGSL